ncbi:unnamed protein product [Alopecurus aequalis]
MAATSPATLVFLLSLICIPSRFLTGALPAPPPTVANPVTPPPATPSLAPALPPAPWDEPGYPSKPVPEPVRKTCARTPFPNLCGRVLAYAVDPQRANDTRHLAEVATGAAIKAGTALAAFGYVHIAGAQNATRLRLCVSDCTVHVGGAVKNLTAAAADLKQGERSEAVHLMGDAAKGLGVCFGSCAMFAGEAMVVMSKRALQLEKLIMIASSIIAII